MSRIKIITLVFAAFAIAAPPALASVFTRDKCAECEWIRQDCLSKAGTDGVKNAKCQADFEKCQGKCTV